MALIIRGSGPVGFAGGLRRHDLIMECLLKLSFLGGQFSLK